MLASHCLWKNDEALAQFTAPPGFWPLSCQSPKCTLKSSNKAPQDELAHTLHFCISMPLHTSPSAWEAPSPLIYQATFYLSLVLSSGSMTSGMTLPFPCPRLSTNPLCPCNTLSILEQWLRTQAPVLGLTHGLPQPVPPRSCGDSVFSSVNRGQG